MRIWEFSKYECVEAYVFLRLLGDGRLYGADKNFQKDELTYIDVINIIRDEPERYLKFERYAKGESAFVDAYSDDYKFKIVTCSELKEKAAYLYGWINNGKGNRTLNIPEIQNYLEELKLKSPKSNISKHASLKYGSKTDIIITSEDSFDHTRTTRGFSIKSHIGSAATLFNCSSTSGFVYRVEGCCD